MISKRLLVLGITLVSVLMMTVLLGFYVVGDTKYSEEDLLKLFPPLIIEEYTNSSIVYEAAEEENHWLQTEIHSTLRKLSDKGLSLGLEPTAIIVIQNKPENIPIILEQLQRTGLFKEAIVWNNQLGHPFKLAKLINGLRVTVIQSSKNIGNFARYIACEAFSITSVCFVQSEDWSTKNYIGSLYGSFLREPHLFHSITDHISQSFGSLFPQYSKKEIGLHSKYSSAELGAFFLKRQASRHRALTQKYIVSDLISDMKNKNDSCDLSVYQANGSIFNVADVAFPLFLNSEPVELVSSNLNSLSTNQDAYPSISNCYKSYLSKVSSKISEIMEKSLSSWNNKERTIFKRTSGIFQKEMARSVCHSSHSNGICVFIAGMKNLYSLANGNCGDNNKDNNNNRWEYAVDNNLTSTWTSNVPAVSGDWFGIDKFVFSESTKISLIVKHGVLKQRFLVLEISDDGLNWKRPKNSIKLQFDQQKNGSGDHFTYILQEEFTAVRFVHKSSDEFRFSISDIQIN